MNTNTFILNLLRMFWYWRKQILFFTTAVFLFTFIISIILLKGSPIYEASTVVTMLPSSAELGFSAQNKFLSPMMALPQTTTEFLLSKKIVSKVVDTILNAQANTDTPTLKESLYQRIANQVLVPAVQSVWHAYFFLNFGYVHTSGEPKDALVDLLRNRISIQNVPSSFILKITVKWNDPVIAKQAADYLAYMYIENSKNENKQSVERSKTFIKDKLKLYNEQLLELGNEHKEFKKNERISSLSKNLSIDLDEMSLYTQEKNRLELKLLELDAKLRNYKDIETQSKKIGLNAELDATKDRLRSVKKLIAKQNIKLKKIPTLEFKQFEIENRQNEIIANIQALQSDLNKINIAEAGALNTFRVIDYAKTPIYPSKPKVLINCFMAIFVGIFLGMGFVVIRETISPRIRWYGDIAQKEIRCIGSIPHQYDDIHRMRFSPWQKITRADETSFVKHVRFFLDTLFPSGTHRIVQIVSPESSPFIAEKVLWLAQQMPPHSMIVNFDKKVHQKLVTSSQNFTTLLDGGKKIIPVNEERNPEDVSYHYYPSTSTTYPAKSDIDAIAPSFDTLRKYFQCTVIITPPLREFSASRFLARHADVLLFMFPAQKTKKSELDTFIDVHSEYDKPKTCIITDVQFPPDYKFR